MATKLQSLLQIPRHHLEPQDVCAAFQRIARRQWGNTVPLEPLHYRRGVLTIRCPSTLWLTEVLFSAETLRGTLTEELPHISLRRISAILS